MSDPMDEPSHDQIDQQTDQRTAQETDQGALRDAVVAELELILLAEGPMSIDELTDAFSERSADLAGDLLAGRPVSDLGRRLTAVAQQADAFWRLADGRLAPVLHHLRRATFTHRLSAGEVERQAVDLFPDVVALALPRSFTAEDGTELRTAGAGEDRRAAEDGSILGPPGWLSAHAAGDLLAVGYDGERMQFRSVAQPDLDESESARVAEGLLRTFERLDGDRAPELHRMVVEAIGEDPASFAVPVDPVAEQLASVGLRTREAWVGPGDRPWPTPPEQARQRRMDELLAKADICCRRSAKRALDAWHAWMRDVDDQASAGPPPMADPAEAESLRVDIDHGPVASVLAEVASLGRPIVTVRRLGEWSTAVAGGDAAVAGVEYLRALGADASGDPLGAEAHLRAGLEVDAHHGACLGFLAELLQDRGDAEQSLAMLRRVGRPLSPETLAELVPFLVDRGQGRNEPCSCGSGRKFKACCLRQPRPRPLVDRSRWLLGRAIRHAVRTDPLAVQSLRQLFDSSTGGPETLGLVADMLLFSTPGLGRYLDARGPLLPEDERQCALGWVGRPMRLLEVVALIPGEAVDAVDGRDGGRLRILDPGVADAVGEGDLILTRPLPVGDEWILTGALLPIAATGRERTLEMLADDVRPFDLLQLLVDLQVEAMRS